MLPSLASPTIRSTGTEADSLEHRAAGGSERGGLQLHTPQVHSRAHPHAGQLELGAKQFFNFKLLDRRPVIWGLGEADFLLLLVSRRLLRDTAKPPRHSPESRIL